MYKGGIILPHGMLLSFLKVLSCVMKSYCGTKCFMVQCSLKRGSDQKLKNHWLAVLLTQQWYMVY
jgi:hypothetical protein